MTLHSLFNSTIASKTIPPRLPVAVKDSTLCSSDLKIGAANLDEGIVGIKIFPKSGSLEGDFGASLELG